MRYPVVTRTDIPEFPLLSRGKVRDIYEIDDDTLLLVTTDRMSAFDVVLEDPVPGKGVILNRITLFWMKRFAHLAPNHIRESDVDRYPDSLKPYRDQLAGRSVLVRRARPLPIECIVRGNLTGSAWKSYVQTGEACGRALPAGLTEFSRLPDPLFTPSTKAEAGSHDESISPGRAAEIAGREEARRAEELSVAMYREAAAYAADRGILIADTKFEFGMVDGVLTLIDEVLTPDSSRFWPAAGPVSGGSRSGLDKQYLRDWLESQPWDKTPPAPRLPAEVVEATARKYAEVYHILTGEEI